MPADREHPKDPILDLTGAASANRPGAGRPPTLAQRLAHVLPSTVRDGRWEVSTRAVIGLAVVVAIVVSMTVVSLRRRDAAVGEVAPPRRDTVSSASDVTPSRQPARSGPPGGEQAAEPARAATASAASVGGPGAASPGSASAGGVLVHVVGKVRRPGVVSLSEGARVEDAVTAAGGATSAADLAGLNLARPVVDGEQVVVPGRGDVAAPGNGGAPPASSGAGAGRGTSVPARGAGGAAGGSAGARGGTRQPLDLNAASASELEALPGVGPVLAQRILDWRTQHGRFRSVDDLQDVSGIGEKTFAELAPLVRV